MHQLLSEKLEQEPALSQLYRELEIPLVNVLSRIERNGALVCRDTLAAHSQELGERILALESQAHELAGGPLIWVRRSSSVKFSSISWSCLFCGRHPRCTIDGRGRLG